jgi:organic hydroperoxide reductase OsmC/OhrA
MMKVELTKARCQVKIHWTAEGSVFAGTISSKCHSVEMHTEVESEDDPALVAALIMNAEGGCFAQSAINEPVPVTSTATLNGDDFAFTEYPRKAPRKK